MPNHIATLIITLDDQGRVEVSGPMENKVLCYGLMGAAHDIINDVYRKAEQRIIPPGPAGLSLVTKG